MDPDDRTNEEKIEFARFKAQIYQDVLDIIFAKTSRASWTGIALRCGDFIDRIYFPGLHIKSLDGEEAGHFCCTRASQANHPCPRCMVYKSELDQISRVFPNRTPENMKRVYEQVQSATTKTAKNNLLISHGLHNTYVKCSFFAFFYYGLTEWLC